MNKSKKSLEELNNSPSKISHEHLKVINGGVGTLGTEKDLPT